MINSLIAESSLLLNLVLPFPSPGAVLMLFLFLICASCLTLLISLFCSWEFHFRSKFLLLFLSGSCTLRFIISAKIQHLFEIKIFKKNLFDSLSNAEKSWLTIVKFKVFFTYFIWIWMTWWLLWRLDFAG